MEPAAPQPPQRTLRHTRQIQCRGYHRADGLFDIEAEMQDTTPLPTSLPFASVPAGGQIHHMRFTMTIDAELVIRGIEARTETGPTPWCAAINAAYSALTGLRIGKGFHREAKARLGGADGCTHLTELLGPLATTAMQTVMSIQRDATPWHTKLEGLGPMAKPWILGTCHAYREGGEAAAVVWPVHRRAAA